MEKIEYNVKKATFGIDEEIYRDFGAISKKNGLTMNEIIQTMMVQYIIMNDKWSLVKFENDDETHYGKLYNSILLYNKLSQER